MRTLPLRSLYAALSVAMFAACPDPGRDTGDDTTDSEDSDDTDTDETTDSEETDDDTEGDTDTDPPESGWGGETGDTSPAGPADSAGFVDSGVVPNPNDTSDCPFGETLDCAGSCYPTYLIADGTCDDGVATPSNFNCVQHDEDGGDCADTDPPAPPGGDACPWIVKLSPRGAAGDVGWTITDMFDRSLYFVTEGTYIDAGRDYEHHIDLPSGDYKMVMRDASADGWDAAQYKIIDPRSGDTVSSGSFNTGAEATKNFTLVCTDDTDVAVDTDEPPAECGDLKLTVWSGTNAFQVGWQLQNGDGTLLFDVAPGQYANNQTYTYDVPFPSGRYQFVMYDDGDNGWNGGSFRIEDQSTGQILVEGGLLDGTSRKLPFVVDCTDTFNPTPLDPGDLDLTCDPIKMLVHTGPDPSPMAWEIRNDTTQALVAAKGEATYTVANSVYTETLPITTSGTWRVRLIDYANDGWDGGFVQIIDERGWAYASGGMSFLNGFEEELTFVTDCPPGPPDPPDPQGCLPGTVVDCNGVCWPNGYQGDGFCDDGTILAPNYACAAGGWDGGDCVPPIAGP